MSDARKRVLAAENARREEDATHVDETRVISGSFDRDRDAVVRPAPSPLIRQKRSVSPFLLTTIVVALSALLRLARELTRHGPLHSQGMQPGLRPRQQRAG